MKIFYHDHDKYITIPELNKLTAENLTERLAQANLASKGDIANFVKATDLDGKLKKLHKKIVSNKTKYLLVKNELRKLQLIDSSLFIGQSYFNNDGAQLSLTFQPIFKTIATFSGLPNTISEWESKGLLNENIKPPYTANKDLSRKLVWINNSRTELEFKGSCLKQDKASFTRKNVVN